MLRGFSGWFLVLSAFKSRAIGDWKMSTDVSSVSSFRFLPLITIGFVVCILTSNTSCAKLVEVGPIILAGGTLFYPLTYIFGDTLTEVYGYSATRKAIWIGFGSLLLFTAGTALVQVAPAPSFWQNQEAYDTILGILWRTNAASLAAYLCGEFFNSVVLAKLKVKAADKVPKGEDVNRGMSFRFVTSTAIGQFFDSAIFVTLGFAGKMPTEALFTMFISSWAFKVGWEVVALPITIPFVKKLKVIEDVDALDRNTHFNPLEVRF